MWWRSLAVAATLWLVPASAEAVTTVSSSEGSFDRASGYTAIQIRGDATSSGLRVTGGPEEVLVADDTGTLSAGRGCETRSPVEVACRPVSRDAKVTYIDARLGAGDDGIDTSGFTYGSAFLFGGRGDDRLVSGPGDEDTLDGGPGDDRLDGGERRDTLDYSGRRRPVYVDLRTGRGGERGERDDLRAIAIVTGGRGPDRLTGGAQAEGLLGGPGDDVLAGGGGNDLLGGSEGADVLHGGRGDDRLNVAPDLNYLSAAVDRSDGSPDRLTCGPGRDSVAAPGRRDVLGAGCERLENSAPDRVTLALKLRNLRQAFVRAGDECFAHARSDRIFATATVLSGGRRVTVGRARGRCPAPRRGERSVRLRLNARGRRLVRAARGKPLQVRVTITLRGRGYRSATVFTVELARTRRPAQASA